MYWIYANVCQGKVGWNLSRINASRKPYGVAEPGFADQFLKVIEIVPASHQEQDRLGNPLPHQGKGVNQQVDRMGCQAHGANKRHDALAFQLMLIAQGRYLVRRDWFEPLSVNAIRDAQDSPRHALVRGVTLLQKTGIHSDPSGLPWHPFLEPTDNRFLPPAGIAIGLCLIIIAVDVQSGVSAPGSQPSCHAVHRVWLGNLIKISPCL
jgi:hypothetical protein